MVLVMFANICMHACMQAELSLIYMCIDVFVKAVELSVKCLEFNDLRRI